MFCALWSFGISWIIISKTKVKKWKKYWKTKNTSQKQVQNYLNYSSFQTWKIKRWAYSIINAYLIETFYYFLWNQQYWIYFLYLYNSKIITLYMRYFNPTSFKYTFEKMWQLGYKIQTKKQYLPMSCFGS